MGRTRSEPNREFYAAVGKKIAETRKRLGITQEALASKIFLTRTSVINIEKGRQQLLVHMLLDIARALHVNPSDLIPEVVRGETMDVKAMLKESGVPPKWQEWIAGE